MIYLIDRGGQTVGNDTFTCNVSCPHHDVCQCSVTRIYFHGVKFEPKLEVTLTKIGDRPVLEVRCMSRENP